MAYDMPEDCNGCLGGEPVTAPAAVVIVEGCKTVPLSEAQYTCARALWFAAALEHPYLEQLRGFATVEHPEIIVNGKLLLDETQEQRMEFMRRGRSNSEHVKIVADYLVLHHLLNTDTALVPSNSTARPSILS